LKGRRQDGPCCVRLFSCQTVLAYEPAGFRNSTTRAVISVDAVGAGPFAVQYTKDIPENASKVEFA